MKTVWILFIVLLAPIPAGKTFAGEAGVRFWQAIKPLCGKAFEGRLMEGTEPSDAEIGKKRLVMHVRECSDRQIVIPFHVGEDRSRTWILSKTNNGVRLKHDHRHENGTEDSISQYGGDSVEADSLKLEFPADEFTAKLIPAAKTNIWTMAIDPEKLFTYALRRETTERRFRVDFDLSRPVPPPKK